jgi:hypothetical protein
VHGETGNAELLLLLLLLLLLCLWQVGGEDAEQGRSCDAGRQRRNESSWARLYEANIALERVVCSDVMLCCGRGDEGGEAGGSPLSLSCLPPHTRISQAALDVDDAAHPGHHHCVSAIAIGELLVELA